MYSIVSKAMSLEDNKNEDSVKKGVVQSYTDTFSPKHVCIGISGLIGAGKSTLTGQLGKLLNAKVLYEPVDENQYLSLFYKDMSRYSFPMQVYLLNHRYQQHQEMIWSKQNTIQDRTIYEDVIFAKMLRESGLMEELDFQTYRHLYENMSNYLHRPDLIIYLDVTPEKALERVKERSRGCETSLTVQYLSDLQKGYEEWLLDVEPRIPVLRLDWNEYIKPEEVAKLVQQKLKDTRRGIVI